jgi:antitoxin HicB
VTSDVEYFAKFEPAEEGGFVITFPDFGWGVSQGDAEEDAREMARDLLWTMAQEHIRKGEDLPRPSKLRSKQYRLIRLPALQGLKAELARRLGIPKTVVDRLFSFDNHTRMDQIEAAFAASGKRVDVSVRDAA